MIELKVDTRELRASMGRAELTQQRLAELAGISPATVSNVLRNKVADLATIAAMATVINDCLIGGGDDGIDPLSLLTVNYID
jgi:transcriptional regulator with XRE-family HTH domain